MDNCDGRLGKQALKGVCRIVDILSKERPEFRMTLEPFETDKALLDQLEGAYLEGQECETLTEAEPYLAIMAASLLWYFANRAEEVGQSTPGSDDA